jgi:hypothetical protein
MGTPDGHHFLHHRTAHFGGNSPTVVLLDKNRKYLQKNMPRQAESPSAGVLSRSNRKAMWNRCNYGAFLRASCVTTACYLLSTTDTITPYVLLTLVVVEVAGVELVKRHLGRHGLRLDVDDAAIRRGDVGFRGKATQRVSIVAGALWEAEGQNQTRRRLVRYRIQGPERYTESGVEGVQATMPGPGVPRGTAVAPVPT